MRYSLRAFLIVIAIAPLVLAYFLAGYFRAAPKRTLLVSRMPSQDFFTQTRPILYIASYDSSRISFIDGVPYESLDYLIKEEKGTWKLYFSEALSGRVIFRPDQRMTKEMDLQFQAVQDFVQKKALDEANTSVKEYLDSHGGRRVFVLNDDDLPELSSK